MTAADIAERAVALMRRLGFDSTTAFKLARAGYEVRG